MATISGFDNLAVLWQSGHVVSYRARRQADRKEVILTQSKREYPSYAEMVDLRHEYRLLKELPIEGVLKPLGLEEHDNLIRLVLEGFEGSPLGLTQGVTLSDLDPFFQLALNLAKTVGDLHRHQLIHGNIYPANILVNARTQEIRLINFQRAVRLARLHPIPADSIPPIDLAYASPEQTGRMNRLVDHRTDFYSLGVTLYGLLTGSLPFETQDPMELVHCHIARQAKPLGERNPQVPEALSRIILKLLAKTPEQRYQGSYGLIKDLENCQDQWREHAHIRGFTPGLEDATTRFRIPRKSYGRSQEKAQLQESLSSFGSDKARCILISGEPGSGKTLLLDELCQPTSVTRAHYLRVPFGTFHASAPYGPFLSGLGNLFRRLLMESEETITHWRNYLNARVGLVDHSYFPKLPGLELLLGAGADPGSQEVMSPRETLTSLLSALAREDKPLVCFLDNLHLADGAILGLISELVTAEPFAHLLTIATFRPEEAQQSAGLRAFLQNVRRDRTAAYQLRLGSLPDEGIAEMIADTLTMKVDAVLDLAGLVREKTLGNPFFAVTFLESLYADKLIEYHYQSGKWQWDQEAIRVTRVTESMAHYLEEKILELDETTRQVLTHAACMGERFHVLGLAKLVQLPYGQLIEALEKALDACMIHPLNGAQKYLHLEPSEVAKERSLDFCFVHQQLHRAAYLLLTEAERRNAHLCWGRYLLAQQGPTPSAQELLNQLYHLNRAAQLVTDHDERLQLARLNLEAARINSTAPSFEAADTCLQAGLEFLSSADLEDNQRLCFNLHLLKARTEWSLGKYHKAQKRLAQLQDMWSWDEQRVALDNLAIQLLYAMGDRRGAVSLGLESLQRQGFNLGKHGLNTTAPFVAVKVRWSKRKVRPGSLIKLPEMTEAPTEWLMQTLMNCSVPARSLDLDLWAALVLAAVELCVKHGNCNDSAFAYVEYGAVLGRLLGDWDDTHALTQLALKLVRGQSDALNRARVLFQAGSYHHRDKHLAGGVDFFREALRYSLETGDRVLADQCRMAIITCSCLCGAPLDQLQTLLGQDEERGTNLHPSLGFQAIFRDWLDVLGGTSARGNIYNDEDSATVACLLKPSLRGLFHLLRLQVAYLENDPEQALVMAQRMLDDEPLHPGGFLYPEFMFFHGLALDEALQQHPDRKRQDRLRQLRHISQQLAQLAEQNPINYCCRFALIQATTADRRDRIYEAAEYYDQAIRTAVEFGFLHVEAIAKQLAARHFLRRKLYSVGKVFLKDARYAFLKWGAVGPAEQLQSQLAHTNTTRPHRFKVPLPARQAHEPGFPAGTVDNLDLKAIIKASSAISEEMSLSRLLQKVMHLLIENAGAQRGYLLLECNGAFYVEAEGDLSNMAISVRQSRSITEGDAPSKGILHYVMRSKQTVVLDDAWRMGMFMADPYIREGRRKSVLCQPVLLKNRLIAVIYLENDMIIGAFTPERCSLLQVLSAQIAISLENARLYQALEEHSRTLADKVEDKTRALSKSNLALQRKCDDLERVRRHMLIQEKMAGLGAMASGLAAQIKDPLSLVKNFAFLSSSQASELSTMLARIRPSLLDEERENLDDLLVVLQENGHMIQHHGDRIDEIVNSMLSFAVRSTNRKQVLELNEVLIRYAEVAHKAWASRNPDVEVILKLDLDPDGGTFEAVQENLGRALVNLLDNAFDAACEAHGNRGLVTLRCRLEASCVEIRVLDNGAGLPEEIREHIFTPFFTTRDTGRGIGLAVAYDIIHGEHGGTLRFETKVGHYTEFIINLPLQ